MFYKNHGSRILVNLSESLEMLDTSRENIEVINRKTSIFVVPLFTKQFKFIHILQSIFCTAALICVELSSDDMLVDILRWALAVQDVALTNTMLEPVNRSSLHVINLNGLYLIF
jgi:hypothetical protein